MKKDWEIIADNLSKTGWSWSCVTGVDRDRLTVWIVDAHRDGKHFVMHADEKLTAFAELEISDPASFSPLLRKIQRAGIDQLVCYSPRRAGGGFADFEAFVTTV